MNKENFISIKIPLPLHSSLPYNCSTKEGPSHHWEIQEIAENDIDHTCSIVIDRTALKRGEENEAHGDRDSQCK
jgi:hypothetical protein